MTQSCGRAITTSKQLLSRPHQIIDINADLQLARLSCPACLDVRVFIKWSTLWLINSARKRPQLDVIGDFAVRSHCAPPSHGKRLDIRAIFWK